MADLMALARAERVDLAALLRTLTAQQWEAPSLCAAPLGAFYQDVVLPTWGFFGTFLTITELAIGLGLIFGVATRLAAVGGLLLLTPIWVMLWPTGGYLWEYPAEDLFPLQLLAIVPAGRTAGLDRRLAPRLGHHWPF